MIWIAPGVLIPETEQTVLDVLRQLAFNLDLNLIALSEFDEKIVITDLGSMDPDTVIEQLKKVVDIEIEFKDDSMIAARKEPEVVVDPDKIKVYRLNHTEPQGSSANDRTDSTIRSNPNR